MYFNIWLFFIWPDQISMRVVSMERTSNTIGFFTFLKLILFLKRVQCSEPPNTKMPTISSFFGRRLVRHGFESQWGKGTFPLLTLISKILNTITTTQIHCKASFQSTSRNVHNTNPKQNNICLMYSQLHHCMKPKTNKIKKSGISHQMFKNPFFLLACALLLDEKICQSAALF